MSKKYLYQNITIKKVKGILFSFVLNRISFKDENDYDYNFFTTICLPTVGTGRD